jgi:predicted RNA-binding Zn-ribbon protein involved in translation (DUF1610 family)
MIVRCGRCGVELDVAGPGEFMCPSCGTRNVVRGAPAAPPQNPFGVPDLGATVPSEPSPGITWVTCPSCRYRFAVGEIDAVTCPSCSTRFELPENSPES